MDLDSIEDDQNEDEAPPSKSAKTKPKLSKAKRGLGPRQPLKASTEHWVAVAEVLITRWATHIHASNFDLCQISLIKDFRNFKRKFWRSLTEFGDKTVETPSKLTNV